MWNQRNKKYIPFFIFVIFLELLILLSQNFPLKLKGGDLVDLAQKVLDTCKNATFRLSCYDREIPKLMDRISMEDAFSVTKIIQEKDNQYTYCHVLGHKLSAREVKKDPSRWRDVLTRCPTTMCNNGCLHGPFLEIFNSESLTDKQIEKIMPDLKTVCEPRGSWNPVQVEQTMCYHALGHLNMYVTRADILKSVKLCREEGYRKVSYEQTCIQGVFMQIFQPLEPEDFALISGLTPKRNGLSGFCDRFDGFEKGACFRESWPLFREQIMAPPGLIKFCSYSKDPIENRRCYSAIMSMVTVTLAVDQDNLIKLRDYCLALPKEEKHKCFGDAATRLIQIDPKYTGKAIEFCKTGDLNAQEECFNALSRFATNAFKDGSSEFKKYCLSLPGNFSTKCLEKRDTSFNIN